MLMRMNEKNKNRQGGHPDGKSIRKNLNYALTVPLTGRESQGE